MGNERSAKFRMPEASWSTLRKIIRAYYAKRNAEPVTVQDVATAAGLSRPMVSLQNNFLKAIGVLEQDSYKLTPLGLELALGISRNDTATVRDATRRIVQSSPELKRLTETLEARAELSVEAFKSQTHLALGVDEADRQAKWIGTILEILVESGLVEVDGDIVRPAHPAGGEQSGAGTPPTVPGQVQSQAFDDVRPASSAGFRRIPVPVSAGAVWYVEVPEAPDGEQVKKFLEMQKLIFDVK
jgi:hypothetical protein